MRWYMDIHKFMSETTRKALQIIKKYNLTSDSDNQNIKIAEREFEKAGVYKTGSGEGKTRRNLFTYFKAYDCIDENEELTEIGRAFADCKITLQEFCFYYVLNYRFVDNGVDYYPAQLILTCLQKLTEKDSAQGYLTVNDFSKLTECNSLDDLDDDFINGLIKARSEDLPPIKERSVGFDVWGNMFRTSGFYQIMS